jgi:parallel beta-helix repeat protein
MEEITNLKKLLLVSALIAAAICSFASATVIYVDDDGPADFNNIQAAIDSANNGDIIEVQPGTYTGEGNRDIDFLGKAITIRGATGDPNDCVIDCQGIEAERHRGFKFVSGEDGNSILEAITIKNGYAPMEGNLYRAPGGAVYCNSSSPSIRNCLFINNKAFFFNHGGYGGAIRNDNNSNPSIENCTLNGNSAHYGGGIYNGSYCHSMISNCTIRNNWASYQGGGIRNGGSDPTISNCIITNNSASNGGEGGGIFNSNSNPTITNCIIRDNSAESYGDGICNDYNSNPTISDCIISNNKGIAICNEDDSNPYINNCIISNNQSHGIYNDTSSPTITKSVISNNLRNGFYNKNSSRPTISNCTINSNYGYGIINLGNSSPNISNCTISDNSETGIYTSFDGNSSVYNSIVWGNKNQVTGAATVNYSNIQGGHSGVGNIDSDPCFADQDANDFHLTGVSPCIDAGDPNYVPEPNETDIYGDPRVIGRIDMGSDEVYSSTSALLVVIPRTLYFESGLNSAPRPQYISIKNYGVGVLNWQISEPNYCNWLNVFPMTGQLNTTESNDVEIVIDQVKAGYGTHSCLLQVIALDAENSPQYVTVNIEILPPELSLDSSNFNFTVASIDSDTAPQVLTIQNTGYDILDWHIEMENGCYWLKVSPLAGQASHLETDEVILSIDHNNIDYGTYSCQFTVIAEDANNSPQVVTVNLEVLRPELSISNSVFNFTTAGIDSNTEQQVLTIQNTGYDILDWHIEMPNDCDWLKVSHLAGQSGHMETDEVILSIDHNNIDYGTFSCQLTVSSLNAQNSPQMVRVNLEVLGPGLTVNPAQFYFETSLAEPNTTGQVLSIQNTGYDTLNWDVNIPAGCNWLNASEISGQSTGELDEVILSIDHNNVERGFHQCEILISAPEAENSPQVIPVELVALEMSGQRSVPSEYPTIQAAIDAAVDGDEVIIEPGRYTGPGNYNIYFQRKFITVRSVEPNNPSIVAATIIEPNTVASGFRIYYYYFVQEGPIIDGLTIRLCIERPAIACSGCIPTIRNCIIEDNYHYDSLYGCGAGIECYDVSAVISNCVIRNNYGSGLWCSGSDLSVSNCIFTGNRGSYIQDYDSETLFGGAILFRRGDISIINCTFRGNIADIGGGICSFGSSAYLDNMTISNCIFRDNDANDGPQIALIDYYDEDNQPTVSVSYSDVQGGQAAVYVDPNCTLEWCEGNLDIDPCFVEPGYWDPNGTPEDVNDDFWVYGDYHLKSEAGRWDANSQTWVKDAVSSPCIDAGEPNSDWRGEIWPHGMRINMGAYGGMPEASMSLSDAGNIADLDSDGCVGYSDVILFTNKWLDEIFLLPEDLDRNGLVNFNDLAIFAGEWGVPCEADYPSPPDGSRNIDLNADLSWTPGRGATSHDVYFGTSNPPPFVSSQTAVTFDPETMDPGTQYYWSINEVNPWAIIIGPVWSFKTMFLEATNPNPADGATDVSLYVYLSWMAGYGASSHDVYFGTSNPPEFIGNQTSTMFGPDLMEFETKYYGQDNR